MEWEERSIIMDIENTENIIGADGAKVYQKHKDRMFCDLFSQKENTISLFNAITDLIFRILKISRLFA